MATPLVLAPPYMLGERPSRAPTAHSCVPSFRQVPFVRISDRVDSGVKVRKQLRKYLKAASATQQMVAQTHLSDACLPALQPQEVAQSCFQDFFTQMRTYSQVLGTKHLAASKAYLDMTKPLENSGRSRRWAKDVYNLVQRCVADVRVAEKKMDKARTRVVRAADDLAHWKSVLSANEATFQVQPNSPEVKKAFQVAQCRFSSAVGEDEAAGIEYDEARTCLIRAIGRRDEVVEEATDLSQSVEEDRLDTLLIVIGQFVETKVAILQAEIEVMTDLQNTLKAMDRNSVVQQYIVDSMAPGLTHRHAKALGLMEWHRVSWRYEQQLRQSAEPGSCLAGARSMKEVAKLKASGVSEKDVEIIKDFVSSCFIEPETALVSHAAQASSGTASSLKHRSKFTDASASTTQSVYRLGVVRRIILDCLRHQRVHDRELSRDGFSRLAVALHFLLDACVAQHDTRTTMHFMNMLQTFYRKTSKDGQEYLHAALKDHVAWRVAGYWEDALLESVAEELNKAPIVTPWYYLADAERAQKVLDVHNIIFGQASAYLYHLSSFGFSRRQLLQYAHSVCYAYELGEEQRISIYSSVRSMVLNRSQEDEYEEKRQEPMECDEDDWQHTFERDSRQSDRASSRVPAKRTADVQFPPTSFTPPDWSSFSSGSDAGFDSNVSKFGRKRRESTASTATTIMEGSTTASYVGSVRDFEDMKTIASTVIGEDGDESWENLFGTTVACSTSTEDESIPSVLGVGEDTSESSEKRKDKLMKRRKNSRKFNDQLRLARTIPLSLRIHEEEEESVPVPTATAAAVHVKKEFEQPPLPPGRPPASAGTLLRHRSSDNIFMAARRETGDLPPTHGTYMHVLRHESGIATDENGGARSERRRHRKLHKARSVASIDTSVLRAETQQAFNVSHNTIDPADQIKMMAARMKSRREEHSDGKIDFVAFSRTRSDATGSTSPSPAAASQELSSTSTPKKDSRTLSGVAALRARFENK